MIEILLNIGAALIVIAISGLSSYRYGKQAERKRIMKSLRQEADYLLLADKKEECINVINLIHVIGDE